MIKSVIVFVTRNGYLKGLATFEDLARPGTKVLHASPDTSGAEREFLRHLRAGANFKNLSVSQDGGETPRRRWRKT